VRTAELPNNRKLPTGCFYKERCGKAAAGCEAPQVLQHLGEGARCARCHLAQG